MMGDTGDTGPGPEIKPTAPAELGRKLLPDTSPAVAAPIPGPYCNNIFAINVEKIECHTGPLL